MKEEKDQAAIVQHHRHVNTVTGWCDGGGGGTCIAFCIDRMQVGAIFEKQRRHRLILLAYRQVQCCSNVRQRERVRDRDRKTVRQRNTYTQNDCCILRIHFIPTSKENIQDLKTCQYWLANMTRNENKGERNSKLKLN
jgi:hypothetical protein